MSSVRNGHLGLDRRLGLFCVWLACSGLLHAAEQPARLTLSYGLQRAPAETAAPVATGTTLSAQEAVRSALTESLSMRSAVTSLRLQGQRLSGVSRAEFLPKLGATAGVLRSGSRANGVTASDLQSQAGLDINWRLKTGAEIKVSNNWARNQLAGSSASEPGGAPLVRSTSVSISQPLLKGAGRVVNEAQWVAAESAFRVATRSLEQVGSNLVAQVLNAYLAVQQAQAATRQAQTAYALAQQVNDLNAALVEAGRSPRNVLLQSALDVSSARLGVAQAENNQRQAVRVLERAMGRSNPFDNPDLVVNQPLDAQDDGPLPNEQALIEAALQNSADLLAARENVLLAESALEVARNGRLPSLAVSVGSEWTPSAASVARSGPNHFVGLSMNYSFDRAPARLEERAALDNLETARAQLADVERQVRDSAIDSLRNLRFALEQRSLMREAFALASQQLDAEVTRQRLGRISPLELSSAQQALGAANRQLLDASRDVFISRINLALTDGSLLTTWGVQSMVSEWIQQAQTESNR